jgi:hypothetical protein
MSDAFVNIPNSGAPTWKSPVATAAALPATGNTNGDTRVALDTSDIWEWNGTTWVLVAGPSGASPSFGIIQVPSGTNPVASIPTDTLTFTSSNSSITIVGNSGTDTVDLTIASGSGIHSINSDVSTAQTLVATTTGTDFTISNPGAGVHNFNLPIASASNTGKLSSTDWSTFNSKGSGSVTSVSVVSANGLAGSVANPTTTPAITLSTSITGILQGNGTAISAATTGNLTDAGTDGITITGGTGAVLGSGTSLSQHVADATHNGYLSSTDWNTFNNKQSTLTLGNLTDVGTDGITITGGTGAIVGSGTTISQHVADTTHSGYLSSTDWNTFNGKQAAGNYITALTGDVTASGPGSAAATLATVNSNVGSFGTASQVGTFTVNAKGLLTAASNTSIQITESQVTNLVSDLASKQSTTLTNSHILVGNGSNVATDVAASGDLTLANTGAFTFNTVNSNVGSFGSSTSIPSFIVNGKGLITAASGNVVVAPAGTLTGTTLNSTVVTSSLTSLGTQSAALNMGSHLINNVTDPAAAQDAATKNYVDTAVAALNPAASVYAATIGSNLVGTYNNGVGGIGATFTITATGAFTLDGTTPPTGSRILIKDQTSGFQNGVYNLTVPGSIGVSPVLTRALDYNQPSDINNTGLIPVINGTVNALSSWQQIATITTVGTDALVFTEFTANPSLYLLKANNLSDVASASTSFNNISPMTTLGDIIYENATPSATRLAGNTTSTRKFLRQVGNGTISAAPAWDTLQTGDLPAGTGTVTSVALTTPGVLYSVSGSPITTSGTLALSLISQSANTVLAAPNGSSGNPSFRSLVAADLPTGNLTDAGTDGITITGGTGSVIGSGTSISQHVADTTHNGYLSSSDWNTFSGKQSTITIGALDAQTANANGLALVSNVLSTQSATTSFPGMVNITTQNFNGSKSFTQAAVGTTTFNTGVPLSVSGQSTIVVPPSSTIFQITGVDGNPARTVVDTFNNANANGSSMQMRRARGTAGTPSAVALNDTIGQWAGIGYGTTGFGAVSTVSIGLKAAEAFSDTAMGTYIQMSTTPTGSITSTIRFKLNSDGTLQLSGYGAGIVKSDSTGLLSVSSSGFATATVTSNTTMAAETIYFADSTSGSFNLTLPAPVAGMIIKVKDTTGQCQTNPITIVRNASEKIEGLAASYVMGGAFEGLEIISNGTDWFLA